MKDIMPEPTHTCVYGTEGICVICGEREWERNGGPCAHLPTPQEDESFSDGFAAGADSEQRWYKKVLRCQEAEIKRLRSALERLATTKCSNETAAKIESTIIVQTGNGEFAAHVARLLTDYAEDARAALNTETDG